MSANGDPRQPALPLPAPPLPEDVPPLPARMVNEYVYCPRLAYLMWVQREWEDTADTVDGRRVHRRVDERAGRLPEPEEAPEAPPFVVRSLELGSERLGLVARMDVVEGEDGRLSPVDIKRGRRPHVDRGAWLPERVQLCVHALILEEHGYRVEEGFLWFAKSRERVRVVFDEELRRATLDAISGLRLAVLAGRLPPPLDDSPKCPRCALVGICLPDEVGFLRRGEGAPRPLAVRAYETLPLYVQDPRARIRRQGLELVIEREEGAPVRARLADISSVVLFGHASITTPALHELLRREIPVAWHSYGGWFIGLTTGLDHRNVELRTAQYAASFDRCRSLALARRFVEAKIRNQRTLLRRNARDRAAVEPALMELRRLALACREARDEGTLLGLEGRAGRVYFAHFAAMLGERALAEGYDFEGRNRRPPTDPLNALLSFTYAMLVRTVTVTLVRVGFDPFRGFYHRPRYGRPALALDLMESLRPVLADSAVLTAVNNGEIGPGDFVRSGPAVALGPWGRRRLIAAFERRLSVEATHPVFGYRLEYRRLIELQARLLARHLLGDIPDYPEYVIR